MPADLSELDDGLDERGRIRREGDLAQVDAAFTPLVLAAEDCLKSMLGERLHSIYLYGSVPRGSAVVGRSDLDLEVVLHDDPTETERIAIDELAADLGRATDVVSEVGIIVAGRPRLLSAAERHDHAFQISCLCTPLWGRDLAEELPDQYPTIDLARNITSGTQAAFIRLNTALADRTGAGADFVRQRVGRRIARLAFTCVLARWPGWTSDPTTIQTVVTAYYPERPAELASCIRLGWGRLSGHPPISPRDHEEAVALLATAAPWWTAEHQRITAPITG